MSFELRKVQIGNSYLYLHNLFNQLQPIIKLIEYEEPSNIVSDKTRSQIFNWFHQLINSPKLSNSLVSILDQDSKTTANIDNIFYFGFKLDSNTIYYHQGIWAQCGDSKYSLGYLYQRANYLINSDCQPDISFYQAIVKLSYLLEDITIKYGLILRTNLSTLGLPTLCLSTHSNKTFQSRISIPSNYINLAKTYQTIKSFVYLAFEEFQILAKFQSNTVNSIRLFDPNTQEILAEATDLTNDKFQLITLLNKSTIALDSILELQAKCLSVRGWIFVEDIIIK